MKIAATCGRGYAPLGWATGRLDWCSQTACRFFIRQGGENILGISDVAGLPRGNAFDYVISGSLAVLFPLVT
jgi:hypothetical protein